MLENERRGRQRIEQVGEFHNQRRPRAGQFHEPELGFDRQAERALRADKQPGEIKVGAGAISVVSGHKRIEVVSAHAAHDFRVSARPISSACLVARCLVTR